MATATLASDLSSGSKKPELDNSVSISEIYSWASQLASESRSPDWIDRWFRTYDLEHARFQLHRKFVEYYNYERPHMALDYSTPAEVNFRDVQDVVG